VEFLRATLLIEGKSATLGLQQRLANADQSVTWDCTGDYAMAKK
jgi:hypothetical protein